MARIKQIGDYLRIFCPGCADWHDVTASWKFNGNFALPTLQPSILLTTGHYRAGFKQGESCWCTYAKQYPNASVSFRCVRCHSFVTDGHIQFLGDCTHALVGQTVDLPEIEEIEKQKETAMAVKKQNGIKPAADTGDANVVTEQQQQQPVETDGIVESDTPLPQPPAAPDASADEQKDDAVDKSDDQKVKNDAVLEEALRNLEAAQKAEAAANAEQQPPAETEVERPAFTATVRTVEFLTVRGYKVDDVAAAQAFVDKLHTGLLPGFIADFNNYLRTQLRGTDHGVTGLTLVCPACGSLTQRSDNAWQCSQDGGCGAFGKELE